MIKKSKRKLAPGEDENKDLTGNPRELDLALDLTLDNVDKYKKWDCEHYDECMYAAGCRKWKQFHCNDCSKYKRKRHIDFLDIVSILRLFTNQSPDNF